MLARIIHVIFENAGVMPAFFYQNYPVARELLKILRVRLILN